MAKRRGMHRLHTQLSVLGARKSPDCAMGSCRMGTVSLVSIGEGFVGQMNA